MLDTLCPFVYDMIYVCVNLNKSSKSYFKIFMIKGYVLLKLNEKR